MWCLINLSFPDHFRPIWVFPEMPIIPSTEQLTFSKIVLQYQRLGSIISFLTRTLSSIWIQNSHNLLTISLDILAFFTTKGISCWSYLLWRYTECDGPKIYFLIWLDARKNEEYTWNTHQMFLSSPFESKLLGF